MYENEEQVRANYYNHLSGKVAESGGLGIRRMISLARRGRPRAEATP